MTGPLPTDAWVVTLAAAGRAGEARRRYQEAAAMPLRPDYFYTIFATFRAMAAIAVGDRAAAEALVTDLTPVAGLLAGAASAALAMQPVAQTLGELSAFLGSLLITSIQNNDIPVIMAITFTFSFLVVIFNMIADVLYGVLDPRIRYD